MIEARDVLDKLGTTIDAIEAIEGVAKHVLGDSTKDAFEALHVIAVIVDALKSGWKDKLTVAEVQTEIKNLRQTLLDNNAAADAALREKFAKP